MQIHRTSEVPHHYHQHPLLLLLLSFGSHTESQAGPQLKVIFLLRRLVVLRL